MHNFSSIYETYNKKKKIETILVNSENILIEWKVELGIARALKGHLREIYSTTNFIVN